MRGRNCRAAFDHPDGLRDPLGYLHRLRSFAAEQWITVEKILEPGEELPKTWPVAGTTGYDAMREANGVFIDHDHGPEFTALYQQLTGDQRTIADHIEVGKRMVVSTLLPARCDGWRHCPRDSHAGPALAEVAIAFKVYRSYSLPEVLLISITLLRRSTAANPDLASTIDQLQSSSP